MNARKFLKSFRYAVEGILTATMEQNLRFHILSAVIVVLAGLLTGLSTTEWFMITIVIALVIGAELFNSAIVASQISTIKEVRAFLVAQQQSMCWEKHDGMAIRRGIVMDGRDIGTVVFPNAELKLFLTASPAVRAERRFKELQAKGEHPIFEEVLRDTNDRDYRDTHRTESPLRQAEDAIIVDNSQMTQEEQMQHVIALFERRLKEQA